MNIVISWFMSHSIGNYRFVGSILALVVPNHGPDEGCAPEDFWSVGGRASGRDEMRRSAPVSFACDRVAPQN